MNTSMLLTAPLAVLLTAGSPAFAAAPSDSAGATRKPDVVFVPTPQPVVDAMLALAGVQPGEMVYDLGCGDGRAVITAARHFGARGIGVDIDPRRIEESRANAREAGVTDRVEFKQEDLFTMQFADADVLFLYLLPELNLRLRPRILDELRPGTRVVSHSFRMAEWEPDEYRWVGTSSIFLWIVPAKAAGEWKVELPGGEEGTLTLAQEFQNVSGTLDARGESLPLKDGRLNGRTLTFRFGQGAESGEATAEIDGGKLTGTIQLSPGGRPEPLVGQMAPAASAAGYAE